MLKRFLLILAIFASTFCSAPVFAEGEDDLVVSINPSSQTLNLTPGEHYEESITVYNIGRTSLDFVVEAVPYQTKNATYDPDFSTQSAYTKIASWITFPETKFSLEPDRAVEVKFNIEVPKDVPGGGQYAAIIVRLAEEESAADHSSVSVTGQLASLIHGHVFGSTLREEGALLEEHLPSLMLGDAFRISSVYENSGNVDFQVTETLTIHDFFTGREAITPASTTEEGYPIGTVTAIILPDTRRTVDMYWQGAPQLGVFRVRHTIQFLNQDRTFDQVVFLCPIWLLVIIIIIILFIIISIISIIRARRQDKPQVF